MAELIRTAFETSRLMEFFTASELSMQMGQNEMLWPVVALKELIDNALDACENSGVAPKIGIEIEGNSMTVTDNAGGIPDAVIRSSLDYSVRVSDKSYYVSPTRGQLGNALKCIYAAPFVLSGQNGHVLIETRGVSYDITITLDRIAQKPVLTSFQGIAQSNCTKVMVVWPDSASLNIDMFNSYVRKRYNAPNEREIVTAFAILNPHAEFTFQNEVWNPTLPDWAKWKPKNPTSPHWYTTEQLRNLIAANLTVGRNNGHQRTVREFVSEFLGLARSAAQKRVTEAAGLHDALLSSLVKDGDISISLVKQLHLAMCEQSKPINPKQLGIIGKEHMVTRMVADYGVAAESVRYKRKVGSSPSEPYILEMAFGVYRKECAENCRTLITGLNWSPTMSSPIDEINQALQGMHIDYNDPVCIVLHIAKPHFEFTERGKGHANV